MKVRANGFIALIPRYGIEGIVYVQGKDEVVEWTLSEDEQILSGPGSAEIRVFDTVPVVISAPEGAAKLSITMVSPPTRNGDSANAGSTSQPAGRILNGNDNLSKNSPSKKRQREGSEAGAGSSDDAPCNVVGRKSKKNKSKLAPFSLRQLIR